MFGMLEEWGEGVSIVLVSWICSEQLPYMKVFHPGNLYRYRELPTDGPGGGRMSMFVALGGCG